MEPVALHEEITAICRKLGLDPSYVESMVLTPTTAEVHLFKGRDGRFKGPKYLVDDDGVDLTRAGLEYVPVGPTDVARELVEFPILT